MEVIRARKLIQQPVQLPLLTRKDHHRCASRMCLSLISLKLNSLKNWERVSRALIIIMLSIGAFGKVRLCKIKKGSLDIVSLNLSAPVKSLSSVTIAKAAGKDENGAVSNSASKALSSTEDEVQLCAIKILSKDAIIKAKQVDHVFNEMALQQSLNHPFIANLKGIQQDARSLYLIMDFVDGGELYKLIQ